MILSPPPWIRDSLKPAATSSRSTILSRKPLGPPKRSEVLIFGKAGRARLYVDACVAVIAPVSTMELITYA